MTRVLIIEDEPPARERLMAGLAHHGDIEVVASLATVAETIRWLCTNPPPDLIFADVQLSDGLSIEIFDQVKPAAPIIFCTAYDAYMVQALAQNGIAYLLKPYTPNELAAALAKYRRLATHFSHQLSQQLATLSRLFSQSTHSAQRRLIARRHDAMVAVSIQDLAYVGVYDGLTILVCRDGRRLDIDRSLSDLEAELRTAGFFRLNRQYLAHPDAIAGFRPYFKGRLKVELDPNDGQQVIVAQPNTAGFRRWLAGDLLPDR